MVQGNITEADTPTIQMGTTPSRLISDPPPSSPPIFTPDALPATDLPLYPGLGRASNMLACIPSGMFSQQQLYTHKKNSKWDQSHHRSIYKYSKFTHNSHITPATNCHMISASQDGSQVRYSFSHKLRDMFSLAHCQLHICMALPPITAQKYNLYL